jgi:hypothetical protein
MRLLIASVCGLFLAASLAGCGGATIPSPPENAKPGPPPGSSDEVVKVKEKEKAKKK